MNRLQTKNNRPAGFLARRQFLAAAACGAGALSSRAWGEQSRAERERVLIAVTLDLEMSRNFPRWDDTHWDYEKGNLNEETKRYAVEACRRVKAQGGVVHTFAVGRVLEQENVDWLREIAEAGHRIGNHTYDHVNVLATRTDDIQFRFRRAPWLIGGRSPAEAIAENIRLTTTALRERLDITAVGFRTPGGFAEGLAGREDVQRMLLAQGFSWVSSKYPAHATSEPGRPPTEAVFDSIVEAQAQAQPFVYPSGLVEVPMSPISDIVAFRTGRWRLDDFLEAIRRGVAWAIDHRGVFDFLGHPSCLYVTDPEFRTVELICRLAREAGERAAIVDLEAVAHSVRT